jgi:[ribosomal protein S5]-alanine N-acetyltransferase
METASAIETERLWLRPPTIDNAEQIYARYGHDPEVCRYMSWKPHRTVDDTVEYLRRITADNAAGRSFGYLIFSKGARELLGSVGGALDGHRLQFGYCLARDAWGKGFATEAASAFVQAAWGISSLIRVAAMCDVENTASARVLEKVGLTREGILRKYLILPNLGESPRDVYMYATVRG